MEMNSRIRIQGRVKHGCEKRGRLQLGLWPIAMLVFLASLQSVQSFARPTTIRTSVPISTASPQFNRKSIQLQHQYMHQPQPSHLQATNVKDNVDAGTDQDDDDDHMRKRDVVKEAYRLPRRAVRVYRDYAKRLWAETNPEARSKIANNKVKGAIRNLQHVLQNDEYHRDGINAVAERQAVLDACHRMLAALPGEVAAVDEVVCLQGANQKVEGGGDKQALHATVESDSVPSMISVNGAPEPITTTTSIESPILEETVVIKVTSAIGEQDSQVGAANSLLQTSSNRVASRKGKAKKVPKKKKQRSVMFGAAMGAIVALWVFSGNYVFTGFFTLMTILGQLEYYRMVMSTGIYPARRISVIGAASMFLTALFAPNLHQICLPMFGLWSMIWFLTMRRQVSSISEIATTFTGMFYLGYVPSFWIRTRAIGSIAAQQAQTTRLAKVAQPVLSTLSEQVAARLPPFVANGRWMPFPITTGSKFIFWTWLCLAFADVGAYFVGRKYGKTKLGALSPAAGATSPNKSVEGVIGGCATSAVLAIFGAWVQKWPYFVVTGALHGVALGLLGLIGDLTASMLKRDAGLKDFGDLIPEHGGILDRVDSFIWSAPYSWLVCAYGIPALRALAGS